MSIQTVSRPTSRVTWHHGPAWLWLLSFVICFAGDALLGRWLLLPIYVAGFYGGMIVIDLLTYPLLERWRAWLRPRGVWAWYVVEVGLMWIGAICGTRARSTLPATAATAARCPIRRQLADS